MLKIRLKRLGAKKQPTYRIIVINSTTKREGRPVQELGHYNPKTKVMKLDKASALEWVKKGAQPTETVAYLIKNCNDDGTLNYTKKEVVKVTLHPFDKVLARCEGDGKWEATLITDFDNTDVEMPYLCLRYWYKYCIPYNKDTVHLLGTSDKPEVEYEIEFSKEFKDD